MRGLHMILKLKSSENCVFGVKTHLEAKPLLTWDATLFRNTNEVLGFPGGSDGRLCLQCRRPMFNFWVRKIPWEGNGYPLQYSCLGNSMDRGARQATVCGIPNSWTQLSDSLSLLMRCCFGACRGHCRVYCIGTTSPSWNLKNYEF